jgi:N6-adenosine-specific RNA methylase IME4
MGAALVPIAETGLEALAAEIRWHEGQARRRLGEAIEHFVQAGGRLVVAKGQVPHGAWLPWVARQFPDWGERYVRQLMELARLVAANRQLTADLPADPVRAIRLIKVWLAGSGPGGAAWPPPSAEAVEAFGLPRNDYRIVLADPPWQYQSWSGKSKDPRRRRVVEDEYPTMPVEAIKALPVAEICGPDALLLCWVTMPLLREGLEVIASWGFEYRTAFLVWGKLSDDRQPAVGFGRYTRSNGEVCLLGRRGAGVKPVEGVAIANLVLSKRGRHSEKPLAQYNIIDRLFGRESPRVELFARRRMPGWDVWGFEAPEGVSALDLGVAG